MPKISIGHQNKFAIHVLQIPRKNYSGDFFNLTTDYTDFSQIIYSYYTTNLNAKTQRRKEKIITQFKFRGSVFWYLVICVNL